MHSAIQVRLRRSALCALAAMALSCPAQPAPCFASPPPPAAAAVARFSAPTAAGSAPASAAPASAPDIAPAAPPRAAQDRLTLDLAAGTYVRLVVVPVPDGMVPAPSGTVVRRTGPDGKSDEIALPTLLTDAPQHLSWVADLAGTYRWVVAARDPRIPPGTVALGLEEERPEGPCDRLRIQAERALWSGRLKLDEGTAGALRDAQTLLAAGGTAAAEVGEQSAVMASLLVRADVAKQLGQADAEHRAQPPAVQLYGQALDLARDLGAVSDQAAALRGLALQQSPERIAAALQPVLELGRQAGDDGAQAETLQQLGYWLNAAGDPAGALAAYREAVAVAERRGTVTDQAALYSVMGDILQLSGDDDAARRALGLSLDLARQVGDVSIRAQVLRLSAELEISVGELQAANEDLVEARDLAAHGGSPEDRVKVWTDSGLVQSYLGNSKGALDWYNRALAEADAAGYGEGIAAALMGIGEALAADGQRAAATAKFDAALKLTQRLPSRKDLQVRALYDLGRAHREMGQAARAVAELQRAVALGPPDQPQRRAQLTVELAMCYARAGRPAEAAAGFDRAIHLIRYSPIVEAAARAGLARLQRDGGQLQAALREARHALALTERVRTAVFRPDQRVSFLATLRGYFELTIDLLMRLDAREPGSGHAAEALAVSEQARARGLLDLLARGRVEVSRGVAPQLKQRETEAATRIAKLERRLSSAADGGRPDAEVQQLAHQLDEAEEEQRDVDASIVQVQPAYLGVLPQRTLGLAEIQASLDQDSALLEYFLGEDASYLFVVTRQGLGVHALAPLATLAQRVDEVRLGMANDRRRGAGRLADDSYRLYGELLEPAAGELDGKSHLILAPDGPLYELSFEALLTGPPPAAAAGSRARLPYLIRERSVSYVPSASVLALLLATRRGSGGAGAGRPAGKAFVGFADPQEGPVAVAVTAPGQAPARSISTAPPAPPAPAAPANTGKADGGAPPVALPGARGEVSRIAALFPGDALTFFGAVATKHEVKINPQVAAARTLHFAAHGSLDENDPENSGLRLAASASEDGLLRVREVFDLDLHADLIVLSACQTGVGPQVSGEGIIGMTRAFLYAGAASVLVSLWQVDDQSTAELMVRFYRHLRQTGDRAAALRQAQLELLDADYPQPYNWAPFILVGLVR